MPPEPFHWDRKDFFRERRHDKPSESLGGSSLSRWRETPHHGSSRWGYSDFRRPPGHGKHGGRHLFPEEQGHGFAPSRPNEKILDDEGVRSSGYREGKYGRSSRENRASFGQKDWRNHSSEVSAPNGPGRSSDVNVQRSVEDMFTFNSHLPHSDYVNSWDQLHCKEQHDKNGGSNGLSLGQRIGREDSLGLIDWRPHKWTRSGSLSSRSSGFGHCSSSKSIGIDSIEKNTEVPLMNATPIQSLSGDAAPCMTSAALSEDMCSQKKPRLGWGEGLAKYEKKKVDGVDEGASKNGELVHSEVLYSHSSNLAEKSPHLTGFSDCGSPATSSSVACSSSPGMEDKTFLKVSSVDDEVCNLSASLGFLFQNHSIELAFNLENLEPTEIANFGSSLSELLQSDDPGPVDSGFVKSTVMSKLMICKRNILKAIEMTESEIDLLESELKLISESGSGCPCPAPSDSLRMNDSTKSFEGMNYDSNLLPTPLSMQLFSSQDLIVEKPYTSLVEVHTEVEYEDLDSLGTATSKLVEPISLGKDINLANPVKHGNCFRSSNANRQGNEIEKVLTCATNTEKKTSDIYACGDGLQLVASSSCVIASTDISSDCNKNDTLYNLILVSNQDSANQASGIFNKLLPSNEWCVDISRTPNISCCETDASIKEKFAKRKRFMRFKERVITLKFRAFQHLWKEDMRFLSIRKHCARPQRKAEQRLWTLHNANQKHRSSIRSRFASRAGNLSLVPTIEIINFANKLLSDSRVKLYRNTLKMPALILDKQEKLISRFISSNALVEEPCAVERERSMINPWMQEEKDVFIEKLAVFGKDFSKISSFLNRKTTADCVEFYYKNHKSDSFKKIKKKPELTKQEKLYSASTYLVTSGKRWNREMNSASLDILGAASAIVANDDAIDNQQHCTSRFCFGTSSDCKRRSDDGILERSSSLDVFGDDRETMAADVLAGICGSLSSEGMSSCITSCVDPGEGYRDWKCPKFGSSTRWTLTPEVTQGVDDETCSDERCGDMDPVDWTDEEKSIFIKAVSSYGKDFAKISLCVRTRTRDQCKVFFSKARKCLGLDMIHHECRNEVGPVRNDTNGQESDSEDACVIETVSVISSNKSGSKTDDPPTSDVKECHEEADAAGHNNLQLHDNLVEVFCGDSNMEHCATGKSVLGKDDEDSVVLSSSEAGQHVPVGLEKLEALIPDGDRIDKDFPIRFSAEINTAGEICDEQIGQELDVGKGSGFKSESVGNNDTNSNGLGGLSGDQEYSHSMAASVLNASLPPVTVSSSGFVNYSGHELKTTLKLDTAAEPRLFALQQENCFVTSNSACHDFAATRSEGALNLDASSFHDFKKGSDEKCQESAEWPLVDAHSSQILSVHPLAMSTNSLNVDISCKKPFAQPSMPKSDKCFLSNQHLVQECHLRKCNSSRRHINVSEVSLLSQVQIREHPKLASLDSSDSEEPCRNGDVKLFGQILKCPSPQHEATLSALENECSSGRHPKLSGRCFNLKYNSNNHADVNPAPTELNRSNYLGLENIPSRSYGFWDGNRIQTGFPLPDSAILLAKYPTAFGHYTPSSSRVEHRSIAKTNERTAISTREASSTGNGAANFQLYRSRDGAKVQPFALSMSKRQDMLFSEMQIRNGFQSVSGIQQARGTVEINVGGGGVLVGGLPCTGGVTDPVAAIRMHYAKAEPYNAQANNIRDESWRGKGDLGSR